MSQLFNFNPFSILPWLGEIAVLVFVLVVSSVITVILLTTHRTTWLTDNCSEPLSCNYKITLLPWSGLIFAITFILLLWGDPSDDVTSNFAVRVIVITVPISQATLLLLYTFGSHQHK